MEGVFQAFGAIFHDIYIFYNFLLILYVIQCREVNIAELLQGAIKKIRFEFPSCVSEGPTEFLFEKKCSSD